MVVPTQLCAPLGYSSLEVTSPAPSSYTTGSVAFQDGDGNPISGIADEALDKTGAASLTGLNLSTSTGLPQFLITLNGEQGTPASVVVQLTWTGTDDPSCAKTGTIVSHPVSTCKNVAFIAASGSGQSWVSDTNLSISPQLRQVNKAMMSRLAGRKTVNVQVLDYPALSVNVLGENLNKGTPISKLRQFLYVNLPKYLDGKNAGVAALWGTVTGDRFSCPDEKIVLVGYSQGAMVVHEFLDQLAATSDTATKSAIRGVVLVADPERVRNSQILNFGDALSSSYGICDYAAVSRATSCTSPSPLTDVPGAFRKVTTDECLQYDAVCDTSQLVHDFGFGNTLAGLKTAISLGTFVHTQMYQNSPWTISAGYRVADSLLGI